MEYIIKRLRYKEENFSERSEYIDEIIKAAETVTKNIIKCVEFHDQSKTTISHWTDVLVGRLRIPNVLRYPYGLLFTRVMRDISSLPEDIKHRINDDLGYGEEFIKNMKIRLLTDKDKGVEKYLNLVNNMNDFIHDDDYYVRVLGILSLILDGEMNMNSFDPSEIWNYKYSNIITYKKNKRYRSLPESKLRGMIDEYIKFLNYEN